MLQPRGHDFAEKSGILLNKARLDFSDIGKNAGAQLSFTVGWSTYDQGISEEYRSIK
jgi:hypothetical protein